MKLLKAIKELLLKAWYSLDKIYEDEERKCLCEYHSKETK